MDTRVEPKKHIAILGGGYNPPTLAYERIIRLILSKDKFNEVWLMPYNKRAFGKIMFADSSQRFEMAKLMANALGKHVLAKDMEIKRKGKSFTIDTVEQLKDEYDAEFYWIIGSDLLYELEDWKDIDKLKTMIKFLCVMRPGYPMDKALLEMYQVELLVGAKQMPDISASEARRRNAHGLRIDDLVPDYIFSYIQKNDLYEE